MPTVDEILNIWEITAHLPLIPDANESDEDKLLRELLVWYWDRWLQIVADKEYWGVKNRGTMIPVDTVEIPKKDANEEDWIVEKKVAVTVTSEAFGILIFANCRNKWLNTFAYKKIHGPRVAVPNDPEKYAGKFTDSNVGQVKYGGWSEEGYTLFEGYKKKIMEFRTAQKEEGNKVYKNALSIVRAALKITDAPKSKKRKSTGNSGVPPPEKKAVLSVLDE